MILVHCCTEIVPRLTLYTKNVKNQHGKQTQAFLTESKNSTKSDSVEKKRIAHKITEKKNVRKFVY